MARLDGIYLLAERGTPREVDAWALRQYVRGVAQGGEAIWAWLMAELMAQLGWVRPVTYPPRALRDWRLADLYWATHLFLLETRYLRKPLPATGFETLVEELGSRARSRPPRVARPAGRWCCACRPREKAMTAEIAELWSHRAPPAARRACGRFSSEREPPARGGAPARARDALLSWRRRDGRYPRGLVRPRGAKGRRRGRWPVHREWCAAAQAATPAPSAGTPFG